MVEKRNEGPVAVLTFSRPDVRNALSEALVRELDAGLREAAGRREVRAVVLTGGGSVFSAGADLKERARLPLDAWAANHLAFEALTRSLTACPKPTVAAVSGWALGGGCELALACDIIVAAPGARFGQPEATRGLIPGMGGIQLLMRRLPAGLAGRMLFTGAVIGAEEAARWGMVTDIDEDPVKRAVSLGMEIAAASPAAVRAIKGLMANPQTFEETYRRELEAWRQVVAAGDALIGAKAFADKRQPTYPDA